MLNIADLYFFSYLACYRKVEIIKLNKIVLKSHLTYKRLFLLRVW